jgi:RNA-dependent RNA polymerase
MRASQLPTEVERELSQLEGRHGQRAEPQAQHRLAGLGEAAAMRVLQKIGASKQPIRNLSAYIQWMANHNASQSQDAACASGSSQQGVQSLFRISACTV